MAESGPTYTGLVLAGLERDPGRVAIRWGEEALTARECLDGVYRTARALAGAGLGRGDGVTVLAGNRPEAVLVRLAANLLGCRVAMPHPDGPVGESVALAGFAGTSALVFDPARCRAAAREARTVVREPRPRAWSVRGSRASPESTTTRTPGTVSDDSATDVAST
ncbi:AMP-binding protein, partial [Kitasatospora sp. NPDC059812]|uniref:AMP-binding protein n=1 Tax=Kitasatospora sp. NPDC059812 TaxID=3346958 RepID=UPI0036663A95